MAVLHIGGSEEVDVINYLVQCFQLLRGTRLEYQQALSEGQREVTVERNLKRYTESKYPMIFILSHTFFDTVWPTASKQAILSGIVNYPCKSVHIWCSSVNDKLVKRYSTMLATELPHFRIIENEKLQFMTHEEAAYDVFNFLKGKSASLDICSTFLK